MNLSAIVNIIIADIRFSCTCSHRQKQSLPKDNNIIKFKLVMFKKNPNRPQIAINLKRVSTGYKVISNDNYNPFSFKRITRAVFKSDLYPNQNAGQQNNNINIASNGTLIQPPLHITLPSFSSWFNIDEINEIEKEAFPEFFLQQDSSTKLFKKTASLYKYYRNFMVMMWRQNSKKYLSPAICRRNLPGDVSSIIRIHAFLQNWGIINFPSKEHIKGYVEKTSKNLICYICQESNSQAYYLAQLEKGLIFQICECCFEGQLYPKSIERQEFRKVLKQNHDKNEYNRPSFAEMKKILQIMHSEYPRQKQMWLLLAKQFPNLTKQQILLSFLQIPANHYMSTSIFSAGEDITHEKQPQEEPKIYEHYENPIQTNIAVSYFLWKTQPQKYPQLQQIFMAAGKHSNFLASQQSEKIKDLTKMLIDVQLSKLELKALYLQEYEKMVSAEQKFYMESVSNKLADGLRNLEYENSDY